MPNAKQNGTLTELGCFDESPTIDDIVDVEVKLCTRSLFKKAEQSLDVGQDEYLPEVALQALAESNRIAATAVPSAVKRMCRVIERRLQGEGNDGVVSHETKEAVREYVEENAKERAHDGGRRPLVAVGEGMVRRDSVGVACGLLRHRWVEFLAAERLKRLCESRFKQSLVAHAI